MAKSRFSPQITSEPDPWKKDGNCRGGDPDLFYPFGWAKRYQEQIEAAKAVCAGCKVVDICLNYALEHNEYGIWGGTTEPERAKIRLQNSQIPASY